MRDSLGRSGDGARHGDHANVTPGEIMQVDWARSGSERYCMEIMQEVWGKQVAQRHGMVIMQEVQEKAGWRETWRSCKRLGGDQIGTSLVGVCRNSLVPYVVEIAWGGKSAMGDGDIVTRMDAQSDMLAC